MDAIADEHHRRVEIGSFGLRLIAGDVVLAQLQVERGALRRLHLKGRRRLRQHPGELDLLQIGAVVAGRLQAGERDLGRDVLGAKFAAPRTGAAALE